MSQLAICWARFDARKSPSVAEMMEPFIRMCQDRANSSGRLSPASSASTWIWPRDPAQVADARLSQRMLRAHFQQHVDERAGLEVVPAEPVTEHVEHREQLFLGRAAAPTGLGNDQVHRPHLVTERQEGQDQGVLGGEMPVERRFGNAGTADELIDPHIADSAAGKQFISSGKDPVHGIIPAGQRPGGQQSGTVGVFGSHRRSSIPRQPINRQACLLGALSGPGVAAEVTVMVGGRQNG